MINVINAHKFARIELLLTQTVIHTNTCVRITIVLDVICCSDFRLCKRGLKEYPVSEEVDEFRTETDSGHSENHDDTNEYSSSDLLYTKVESKVPDDVTFDGEFAQDVEQMKLMGLPLSFTQASERRRRKVCVLVGAFVFVYGQ